MEFLVETTLDANTKALSSEEKNVLKSVKRFLQNISYNYVIRKAQQGFGGIKIWEGEWSNTLLFWKLRPYIVLYVKQYVNLSNAKIADRDFTISVPGGLGMKKEIWLLWLEEYVNFSDDSFKQIDEKINRNEEKKNKKEEKKD